MEATEFLLTFILLLINYVPAWIMSNDIDGYSSVEDRVILFFLTFFGVVGLVVLLLIILIEIVPKGLYNRCKIIFSKGGKQ